MLDTTGDLRTATVAVGAYPSGFAFGAKQRNAAERAVGNELNGLAVGATFGDVDSDDFRDYFATFFDVKVVVLVDV